MEKLIQELTHDHGPRKVLASPEKRVFKLAGLGMVFSALVLTVSGVRSSSIATPVLIYFLGEILLIVGLLLSGLSLVLLSSIPGESIRNVCIWSCGFLAAWLCYLAFGVRFRLTPEMPLEGGSCLAIIGLAAILPVVVLTREARKGMPLKPKTTALGIGLSAAAIAVLGLEAHCEWESALHHIVFHFLPAVAVTVLCLGAAYFLRPNPIRTRS